jgi:amidase
MPVKVGVIVDPGNLGVHPDVADAVKTAARELMNAGYIVEEREAPMLPRATEIYTQIMDNFSRVSARQLPPPPGMFSTDFERFWTAFNPPWKEAAGEASHDPMMERATIARAWADLMVETPLILAPIATVPAWKVGADLEAGFGTEWLRALRAVVVVNLLGLPSVAIPTGLANGLPQVVQIIGPRFREDLCLDAAEAIEVRLPRLTPIEPTL